MLGTAYAHKENGERGYVLTLGNELFAINGQVFFGQDLEQMERLADYFEMIWGEAWRSQRLPN